MGFAHIGLNCYESYLKDKGYIVLIGGGMFMPLKLAKKGCLAFTVLN